MVDYQQKQQEDRFNELVERVNQLESDKITLELGLSYLQWQIDNLKMEKTND